MAYGFDFTKFQDKNFVNELTAMTTQFYDEGRTMQLIDHQVGNKNREALNMFTNDITVQDGFSCNFVPNADVNMIQKFVSVEQKTVMDSVCWADLQKTYLAYQMKNYEIPFETQLAESYKVKVNRFNEVFIWNGSETYDGLIKQIGDSNDVIDASAEVEVATTYRGKVGAMIAKATSDILQSEDLRIFCSHSFYTSYVQELLAANLYNRDERYSNGDPMKMEMYVPGTNILITPVLGIDKLTNVTKNEGEFAVLTYSKNLVVSYDGISGENERFQMLINPYNNNALETTINWTIGSAFRWDDRIVRAYSLVSES